MSSPGQWDAAYIRTSTDGQDGEAQRAALVSAAPAGVRFYVDRGESGTKTSRPALDELLRDARAGKVRAVYVSALDRIGRSLAFVVLTLDELSARGVRFVSIREGQSIDPTTPIGRAVAGILATVAQLERELIVERVVSGVRRAQAHGTRSGRPIGRPRREVDAGEVERRRAAGESWRSIARAMHVPVRTLRRGSTVAKPTP